MFRKIIKGLKDVWCGTLEFDTEPKKDSFNPVTSGGVYDAINGAGGAKEIVYFDVDPSDPPSGIYAAITEALSKKKEPVLKIDGAVYFYTATGTDKYVFVGGYTKEAVGYTEIEVSDDDSVTSKSVDDKVFNMYMLYRTDPASPGDPPGTGDQPGAGYWICDENKHVITKTELMAAHANCRYFVLNNDIEPDSNTRKYFASVTVISNSNIRILFSMIQTDDGSAAEFTEKLVMADSEGRLYVLRSYEIYLAETNNAVLVSEPQNFDSTQKAQGRSNIGAASASDVTALQSQVSSLSDVSAYSVKGEATVAQLNAGPSGIQAGWAYQLTDSGTLTEGSLAVVAGDTVAWDGTKWFPLVKSDYYATKTYAQNVAHSLAQEFDPERTSENPYKAGENVTYTDGKVYTFKVDHYGAWNSANVDSRNEAEILKDFFENPHNSELIGELDEELLGKSVLSVKCILNARIPYATPTTITSSPGNRVAVFDVSGREKIYLKRKDNNFQFLIYGFSQSTEVGAAIPAANRIISENVVYVDSKTVEISVPSGYSYFVLWYYNETDSISPIDYLTKFIVFSMSGAGIKSEVAILEKQSNSVSASVDKKALTSDQIYTTTGFQTFPSWYSTDYIDISNWFSIDKIVASTYNNLYTYAFFDSSKAFISGYKSSSMSYETLENVPIPSGAKYIRCLGASNQGNGLDNFLIEYHEINTLQERYDEFSDFAKKEVTYDDLGMVMQKICCIGDSLTEGDYGSYPSGTANVHSQNYPFYLEKITAADVDNLGHCGDSALYWWQHRRDELLADADYDCIYIFLGQNGEIAGNVEDVTSGGDYWEYPETNLGGYCAIIEHCQHLYPHAHIFLINQPYNIKEPSWTEKVSEQIRKVAVHYGLPVIDIMRRTPMNRDNGEIYRPVGYDPVLEPYGNQHFGKIGYYTLAKYIFKLTCEFVNDNKILFALY